MFSPRSIWSGTRWRPMWVDWTASTGRVSSAPIERARSQLWTRRSPITKPATCCLGMPMGESPSRLAGSASAPASAGWMSSHEPPGSMPARPAAPWPCQCMVCSMSSPTVHSGHVVHGLPIWSSPTWATVSFHLSAACCHTLAISIFGVPSGRVRTQRSAWWVSGCEASHTRSSSGLRAGDLEQRASTRFPRCRRCGRPASRQPSPRATRTTRTDRRRGSATAVR